MLSSEGLFRTSLWYTPELLRANPDFTFIFGDNTHRVGKTGQAIIRDEPNALGLATKRRPDTNNLAYFEDTSFLDRDALTVDLIRVLILAQTRNVVIPFTDKVELGTGLSELPTRAPKLYGVLSQVFTEAIPTASLVQP